mgnify:CR=1 FL=1|tara:strand:+ start:5587 stop:6510 length:924 start_codon:yes stop_codon:yes gene_type:complete
MKIMVMGTGGVGGFFGAKLARAGHNVYFIARGKHLEAIKKEGLKVISELGNLHINPSKATDNPTDFEIPDIILLCVKAYDIESSCKLIKPLVGPNTGVIPLLNGITHIEIMQNILGKNNVTGGVAAISALIEEPGVIIHNSTMQMLKFGEINNEVSIRIKEFQKACNEAGINNNIPNDIQCDMWQKLILMCSLAGVNCLTRLPLGPCRDNPSTRILLEKIAAEIILISKTENVNLPDNQLEITMKQLDSLPEGMKASTLPALEKGEKLEASALHGAIEKLGIKNNISTPINSTVYAALAPHENGINN